MGQPAARVGDMTAHGSPLAGAPGCPTVLIGNMPAWRGLSPAAAAALSSRAVSLAAEIAAKSALASATAGTPAGPAAQLELVRTVTSGVSEMTSMMAGSGADMHACPIVKLVIPDGPGVVTSCSMTVMIGGMGAARMGDPIQECTSASSIAMGAMNVLIG
jgi:uncharacterized Zn-binding protein involved in type VI secretion